MSATKRFKFIGREINGRGLGAIIGLAICLFLQSGTGFAQGGAPGASRSDASAWANIVSAAKKEGKVTLYTSQVSPVVARFVDGFKKAYPEITLETFRAATGALLARMEQERAVGADGADVFISPESLWYLERAKEGKLLKLVGPAITGWPSQYLLDGAIAVVSFDPFIIPYNKTLVKAPPKSYADLLKPEFKGKIGTPELISTTVTGWYDWMEKTQGSGYLLKLKAQNPKMYTGVAQLNQALASGEILASTFGIVAATKPVIEKGAPLDFVLPTPGLAFHYDMAAMGWSKRPNAALVLADYVMSREGQTIWHGNGESASPLPNVPGALPSLSIALWDPAAYPPEVVKKFRDRWMEIMK